MQEFLNPFSNSGWIFIVQLCSKCLERAHSNEASDWSENVYVLSQGECIVYEWPLPHAIHGSNVRSSCLKGMVLFSRWVFGLQSDPYNFERQREDHFYFFL